MNMKTKMPPKPNMLHLSVIGWLLRQQHQYQLMLTRLTRRQRLVLAQILMQTQLAVSLQVLGAQRRQQMLMHFDSYLLVGWLVSTSLAAVT